MAITTIPSRDIGPADVPLMSLQTPRSDGLVIVLHPLMVSLLLLYLFPSLFSDYTAQLVWETYHLDTLIASQLEN